MATISEVHHTVDAPVGRPHRFGLFSLLEFTPDADEHVALGIEFESACWPIGTTRDSCVTLEPEDLQPADCSVAEFAPFTVYAAEDRLIAGRDAEERSRFRLFEGEEQQVEREVWAQLLAAAPPVNVETLYGFAGPELALAYVQAVMPSERGQGTILMSEFAAVLLSDYLVREGSRVSTVRGTPVAILDSPETDAVTVFGVGPLVGYRTAAEVFNGFDRAVNTDSAVAQRTYVIGWDCTPVGATFPIPDPV